MRPIHPAIRAVIFDMDGLLVDSEPLWRRVETEIFDDLGVDIRPLLGFGFTKGLRVDEAVAFFRARLPIRDPDDAKIAERIVIDMVQAIREEAELKPGALDALQFCADRGLVVALASGSTPPVIDAVLERFSLSAYFATVSSAEHDERGKPHPAIFLRTAQAIGVQPGECVVLEDSFNGCIAAKAAQMRVIAIPDDRAPNDQRFVIADLVLPSLSALIEETVVEFLGLQQTKI